MDKRGQIRIPVLGFIDIISLGILALGVFAVYEGQTILGWILIIFSLVKQFSGY